jgi:hypothetical protein
MTSCLCGQGERKHASSAFIAFIALGVGPRVADGFTQRTSAGAAKESPAAKWAMPFRPTMLSLGFLRGAMQLCPSTCLVAKGAMQRVC